MAVRPLSRSPAACLIACSIALASADSKRPASAEPAPTLGLTTNSLAVAAVDSTAVSTSAGDAPGPTNVVGMTGAPAAASSARYRLSEDHRTESMGLRRFGTVAAH